VGCIERLGISEGVPLGIAVIEGAADGLVVGDIEGW